MKFKLEIQPGASMVSADDFAGALERAAAKIRENGNDGLYKREQVEQVRDEEGVTVGEWSLTDGVRTSVELRAAQNRAARLARELAAATGIEDRVSAGDDILRLAGMSR